MTRVAWDITLVNSERGVPHPTLSNAVLVLQKDPTLGPNRLWYDEFLDRVLVANSPTREWRDEDDFKLTVYMQDVPNIIRMTDTTVSKAVRLVARQRTKHVVREFLSSLKWDGVPRIALAFEDHWSVQCGLSQPEEYIRAASRNFFIGLVARIFRPGCQLDTMVVFEGDQGIKKTSALRVLAGDWYAIAHESVTRKDFFEAMRGKWIIEIGELDAFSRAEVTRVKTVVSTPTDRYRPSYGRASVDFPRQCIFAGTTNKDDWGDDDTGLRRFWPVKCGPVNVDTLAAARSQLLAEAVSCYHLGSTWWEMPVQSTLSVQSDRQYDPAWTSLVLNGLTGQDETTVAEVLMRILKHEASQITKKSEMTVAGILRKNGWRKSNLRREGRQGKTWVRGGSSDEVVASGSDDNSFIV